MLGERSSGTNFISRLLGRNTPLRPSDALGWKHGAAPLAIPPDLVVVCVVRNAASWALSMHARPWHATPALQRLALPDFLRAEWDSTVDRAKYFNGAGELVGQPLLADRDASGRRHANLFRLRTAKLQALARFGGSGASAVLLRLEEAQVAPERVVDGLRAGLGLPPRETSLRPVVRRLGTRFKPAIPDRPETPKALAAADLAFLRAETDAALEAELGYTY